MCVVKDPRMSAGTPALEGGARGYRQPVERPILRRDLPFTLD